MQNVFSSVLMILAALIVSLFGLPILLLYIATAVPFWISISLTAVYLGAVLSAFLLGLNPILALLLLLGASFAAVWLSQIHAKTPAIVDAKGKGIEGSIASLEAVELGGSKQWISIRGKSTDNPILLWLAGGPGSSDIGSSRAYLKALEDDFLMVGWDQAGSVKSFSARELETLSPESYISDARELIEYLRERFQQEKIYLIGHSWGSLLGVWLVQRYPEYFHAYIAIGLYVNARLNDEMNFEFALELVREQGKAQKVAMLEKQGIPPYTDSQAIIKYANYMTEIANHSRSKLKPESKDVYTRLTLDMLLAQEYGIIDKINIYRSAMSTFRIVTAKILDTDLMQDAPCLEVPFYLLQGRWDMNCVTSLAEAYFEKLEATDKHYFPFEHSAHLPHYEEAERFLAIMRDIRGNLK